MNTQTVQPNFVCASFSFSEFYSGQTPKTAHPELAVCVETQSESRSSPEWPSQNSLQKTNP